MALVRRLREVGDSLSVVIPSDFVKALGLGAGDDVEFVPESRDAFRIRVGRGASREPRTEGPAASDNTR